MSKTLRLVCISDTHNRNVVLPDGDVLIHGGDLTSRGWAEECARALAWLGQLRQNGKFKHVVFIAGNHDFYAEKDPETFAALAKAAGLIYLRDSVVEIDGINFWGAPWQPWFYDWAFNLERGPELQEKWDLIPSNTHVLITHGPPYGYGDTVMRPPGDKVGCENLKSTIQDRVKPLVHIFGHIHEGYGVYTDGVTQYINASTCTLRYKPTNAPIIVDLDLTGENKVTIVDELAD